MLLSDRDIRAQIDSGRVALDPYDPAMIQPSSIDVRLDKFFRVFDNHKYAAIDPVDRAAGPDAARRGRAATSRSCCTLASLCWAPRTSR